MFVRVGEICPPTSLHNDQPLFASCIARRSMTHKHRLRTPEHTDYTLPARRCASAGTSYGPASVCLCLSVTSRGSIKKNQRINLVFGMEAFSTSPTLSTTWVVVGMGSPLVLVGVASTGTDGAPRLHYPPLAPQKSRRNNGGLLG